MNNYFFESNDTFIMDMKEWMKNNPILSEDIEKLIKPIPWNKGKVGLQTAWNKGIIMPKISENTREKMRNAQLGKKLSEEHKSKIGKANSISKLGNTPWNKGRKHSEETKKKISEAAAKRWNKNG